MCVGVCVCSGVLSSSCLCSVLFVVGVCVCVLVCVGVL